MSVLMSVLGDYGLKAEIQIQIEVTVEKEKREGEEEEGEEEAVLIRDHQTSTAQFSLFPVRFCLWIS